MLTSLCGLSAFVLLNSAVTVLPRSLVPAVLPCVHQTVGTGGDTADTTTLLTSALLTSYATVEKALKAYWDAHPDLAKAAEARSPQSISIPVSDGQEQEIGVIDYPSMVQHDTAIAGLFAAHHFDPAQFQLCQRAVWRAIAQSLRGQSSDTATILSRNAALVQARRPELALDWKEVRFVMSMWQSLMDKANQAFSNSQQGLPK